MSLVCGSRAEHGKASVDTAGRSKWAMWPPVGERERAEEKPKALSTDAARAGGPARSSCEVPARWGGGGAKGPAHQDCGIDQPGPWSGSGRKRGSMPKLGVVKPFDIPKQAVWEAYKKVTANKGAPGVDVVTLGEFESDLKNNLYKIWNRMWSGSYFPASGASGGDTEAAWRRRALARSAHCRRSSGADGGRWLAGGKRRNRCSTPTPTGTGRARRAGRGGECAGSGAGRTTGERRDKPA